MEEWSALCYRRFPTGPHRARGQPVVTKDFCPLEKEGLCVFLFFEVNYALIQWGQNKSKVHIGLTLGLLGRTANISFCTDMGASS